MNKKYLIDTYRNFDIYLKKAEYFLYYKYLCLAWSKDKQKLIDIVDESYKRAYLKTGKGILSVNENDKTND